MTSNLNIQAFFDWLSTLPLTKPFCPRNVCPLETYSHAQGRGDILVSNRRIIVGGQSFPHQPWTAAFIDWADNHTWTELTPVEAITFLIGYDSNLLRKEGMGEHLDSNTASPPGNQPGQVHSPIL